MEQHAIHHQTAGRAVRQIIQIVSKNKPRPPAICNPQFGPGITKQMA